MYKENKPKSNDSLKKKSRQRESIVPKTKGSRSPKKENFWGRESISSNAAWVGGRGWGEYHWPAESHLKQSLCLHPTYRRNCGNTMFCYKKCKNTLTPFLRLLGYRVWHRRNVTIGVQKLIPMTGEKKSKEPTSQEMPNTWHLLQTFKVFWYMVGGIAIFCNFIPRVRKPER